MLKRCLVILALGLLTAFTVALPHRDIATTIDIAAPPERVWSILTDTAAYPAWNPQIAALIGPLTPGAVVENREGTGEDQMVFHPTILVATAPRELRWLGHVGLPRILDAEHYFLLAPTSAGTRFTQGEHLRGVLLWTFDAGKLIPRFNAMNAALKARAEHAP